MLNGKRVLTIVVGLLLVNWASAATSGKTAIKKDLLNRRALTFEANRGQVSPQVQYLMRAPGYTLFLTPEAMVFSLPKGDAPGERGGEATGHHTKASPESSLSETVVLSFLEAEAPQISAAGSVATRTHYIRGRDPSKWVSDAPHFEKVRYSGLYAGIDALFYDNQGSLEYDLIVAPGADPKQIKLSVTGGSSVRVGPDGELIVGTDQGEIKQLAPRIYQEHDGARQAISGRYSVEGRLARIEIGAYDPTRTLVIDPVLIYSTYLGGTATGQNNQFYDIAADSSGNIYVTGQTGADDYPLANPIQDTNMGGTNEAVVSKIDPTGSFLIYSTYIGGESNETGWGIAVGADGCAYVGGRSSSDDFPITDGAFEDECTVNCPFVLKLSPMGDSLVYSTFVGAGDGHALAIDPLGQAYITGRTAAANDFPLKNADQEEHGGGFDAFVAKLNAGGSDLIYSTFLGGSSEDNLSGEPDIWVDADQNAYITGTTRSTDFPVLNGVQAGFGGMRDAFVAKYGPTGTRIYSSYLGGEAFEQGRGIVADDAGNAYVTGMANSDNFPTVNPLQETYGGGNQGSSGFGDAFVSKIGPNGNDLLYSTFFGGGIGDRGNAISLDEDGDIYIVGWAGSSAFPLLDSISVGSGVSAFVAQIAADGSELLYSSLLGSGEAHSVLNIGKSAFVAGRAGREFPVFNALQRDLKGSTNNNGFIAQIAEISSIYFAQIGVGVGLTTEIVLTNPSELNDAPATIKSLDDDGEGFPVVVAAIGQERFPLGEGAPVTTIDVTVPAKGSISVLLTGEGTPAAGAAVVESTHNLGGVARFTIEGIGTSGVGATTPVNRFIVPVRFGAINTGIALHNSNDALKGFTATLQDAAGEQLGIRASALAANGHIAQFIDEMFGNVNFEEMEDFKGTLILDFGLDKMVGTALELDGQPGQFTTLPVTPAF